MKHTKLTALILTGTMALSLLPLTAMADTTIFYGDDTSVTQEEASQTYESTEAKPVVAVEVDGAKSVTVNGDVIGNDDHSGINAIEGSYVELGGNIKGKKKGIMAHDVNTQVNVGGDVISTDDIGVDAESGAYVEVVGSVTGKEYGVFVVDTDTQVIVGEDVIATNGKALLAGDSVNVEVGGSVKGTSAGVDAAGEGALVTVRKDVTATDGTAVAAEEGANVVVGSVISKGGNEAYGVTAVGSGTKVLVLGSVEAGDGNNTVGTGIEATERAEVRVYGDVDYKVKEVRLDSVAIAAGNATVLVNGNVNAKGSGYAMYLVNEESTPNLVEITGDASGDVGLIGSETDTAIIGGSLDGTISSLAPGETAVQVVLFKAADAENMFDTRAGFLTEAEYVANTHYIIKAGANITLDDKTIVTFYGVPDEEGGEGEKYDTVIEGQSFTVSVKVPKGSKLKSFSAGDGIDFIDNGDGTYTITAVRGGGIELEALLKKIAANVKKSSAPGIYVSDTEAVVTADGAKLTAQIACSNMAYVEAQLNYVTFRLDGEVSENKYYTVTLSDTGKLEITLASELIAMLEPGLHIVEMRLANGKTIIFEVTIA